MVLGGMTMGCVSVTELGCKEVINVCDGARYGCVCDVEMDIETAQITAIIVPRSCNFLHMIFKREHYVIPWCCIKRIGPDIILVDYQNKTPLCRKKRGLFSRC